ncbi:MAG: hypothetical protein WC622_00230 [Pedobacter sp.]|jgi:hypothetical protein|uniref:DUF6973 domain-containing protein n=1 Tax=Pedobacter sp. TaxID=1411316 RepID=UPI00356211A2
MKKLFKLSLNKVNFRLILFSLTILTIINSCKKDGTDKSLTDAQRIINAKNWYQETMANSKSTLGTASSAQIVIPEIIWNNAKFYRQDDGSEMIGIPVNVKLATGTLAKGSYLLIITKTTEAYEQLIVFNKDQNYFNGNIDAAEVKKIHDGVIKANVLHKAASITITPKGKVMTLQGAPTVPIENQCTDWYWTTWNGNTGEVVSEVYLYSTCSGGITYGGGGSGGDTTTAADTDEIREFEIDYKTHMSTTELAIYNNMNRVNQLSYLINAKTALDLAFTRFPDMDQTDTKADAFRHAYFSLLNVKELGLTLATRLGNAHEEKPDQSALAKQMDLFNNNVGRNAYSNLPAEAAYWSIYSNTVYNLVTNGNLVYINNGQLKPTNQ